jgi:hypothetical protein
MPTLHLQPPLASGLQWPCYAILEVRSSGTELTVRCLLAQRNGHDDRESITGVEMHPDCFAATAPFRVQLNETDFWLLCPYEWTDES